MENTPENGTQGDGTKNTENGNSSLLWRRRVGNPETPQCTGRVPALSGADVTHRGTASAFMLTTTSKHGRGSVTAPAETSSKSRHRVNTRHWRSTNTKGWHELDSNFIVHVFASLSGVAPQQNC